MGSLRRPVTTRVTRRNNGPVIRSLTWATLSVWMLSMSLPAIIYAPHPQPKPASGIEPIGMKGLPTMHVTPAAPNAPSGPVQIQAILLGEGKTLLDEEGFLQAQIDSKTYADWKRESLTTTSKPRKARLLLQMGEVQLASHEPDVAQVMFDRAAGMVPNDSPDRGLARFDSALSIFLQGRFGAAKIAFRKAAAAPIRGVNRRLATIYARHCGACEGYHQSHLELGIPQPTRLDPLCGVTSIAVCLRGRHMPYEKKNLLAKIKHDGEGSSMGDLLESLRGVGLTGALVTADDKGLARLPLPLVAHVERDHFVAVTRVDKKGVTYVCSDCGPWPGGSIHLDWAQWHAMEPDRYLVVAKPGSVDALMLDALPITDSKGPGHILMASTSAMNPGVVAQAERALAALGTSVVRQTSPVSPPYTPICGARGTSPHCPCPICCAIQGAAGGRFGTNDPVNLGTAEEEYVPPGGLHVYNPTGPAVNWNHMYYSLANTTPNGFGSGWTHNYNVRIEDRSAMQGRTQDPTPTTTGGGGTNGDGGPVRDNLTASVVAPGAGGSVLVLQDSARIMFTTDVTNPPTAASPVRHATVQAGFPVLIDWCYNTTTGTKYFVATFEDRSKWTFEANTGTSTVVGLSYPIKIEDRVGNYIKLNWSTFTFKTIDPVTGGFSAKGLTSITDSANVALLTVGYDSNARTVSVSDRYSRSVYYTVANFANTGVPSYVPTQTNDELTQVSQIVTTGTSTPPIHFQYGYQNYGNTELAAVETIPYLHTISVPSPTGTGMSTATINYDSIGEVTDTVDANGNKTVYSAAMVSTPYPHYVSNSGRVQVKNPSGTVIYQYDKYFDSRMSETKLVNGAGQTVYTKTYGDANTPYAVSSITDGNGRTWGFTFDAFGHMKTATTPKGVVTTHTYDYTQFALGEVTSISTGSRTAKSFTYYEPSGLIHETITPVPGNSGSPSTQTTTCNYDAMGNITSISMPGNNATSLQTCTYGYTTDGSYTQAEALGEPIRIVDGLGKVTHLRYDSRRNLLSETDPVGNQVQHTYNIANQRLTTTLPATGQTGSGNATQTNGYLYTGGPAVQTVAKDESGTTVRTVTIGYGAEGERLSRSGSLHTVNYTYDPVYHLKTIKDGNNNTTTYTYDVAGRMTKTAYPGATGANYDQIQVTSYDPLGHPLSRTDGNGQVTNYTYGDTDGRLSAISYPGKTQYNVSLGYDLYDQITSVTDAVGTATVAYDDLGNTTSTTRTFTGLAAKTTTYTYWPNGSRKTMVNPAGTWTYNYDANGRATSLVSPAGTSSSTYLDNGWESSRTLPNGSVTGYSYNAVGVLTGLLNQTSGGTTLSQYGSFAYNGVYDLTSVTSSVPSVSSQSGITNFQYDSIDRLLQEQSQKSGGYTDGFGYDAAGNSTTFKGASQSFNSDNELTGTGMVFDGNGDPSTYKGTAFTFDPSNRVSTIGSTWSAGYQADGLRGWKSVGGTKTYFLYDRGEPVTELDSSGNVTAINVFANDGLVARKQGSTWTYYTFDQQGSVAQRLNSSQAIQSSSTYTAHGLEASSGTPADTFGYNAQWGYYLDRETGLYLCRYRYYDAAGGRFVNRDPSGFRGGINLYAYTNSSVVGHADPTGLLDSVSSTCRQAPTLCAELIDEGILGGGGAGEVAEPLIEPILEPITEPCPEPIIEPAPPGTPEIPGGGDGPGYSDPPPGWDWEPTGTDSPPDEGPIGPIDFFPPPPDDDGGDDGDDGDPNCRGAATQAAQAFNFLVGGGVNMKDLIDCLEKKCKGMGSDAFGEQAGDLANECYGEID